MTIHPKERTTPPPRGPADATGTPAVPAPLPASPAIRPTVPQEDLEEVPDAISPFGPS